MSSPSSFAGCRAQKEAGWAGQKGRFRRRGEVKGQVGEVGCRTCCQALQRQRSLLSKRACWWAPRGTGVVLEA